MASYHGVHGDVIGLFSTLDEGTTLALEMERQKALFAVLAFTLLVAKLSGGHSSQARWVSNEDYASLAQKEMLVGGQELSSPLRVRMQQLSMLVAELSGNSTVGKEDVAKKAVSRVSQIEHHQVLAGGNNVTNTEGEEVSPAGWNKAAWGTSDWAFWVLTGPIITVAFSFFMFYTYGVPAGILTLLVCAVIDSATFYYNW